MEQEHHKHGKEDWYDKIHLYLLIIPIVFFVFSLVFLGTFQAKNGDLIYKDVSLTGGTTISVFDSKVNIDSVKTEVLKQFPDALIREISNVRTGDQQGFILETKADVKDIQPALEKILGYKLTQSNSSVEFAGSSLSSGFYKQLRLAVIIAFLLMAAVVFIIFRTFVPSFTIVLCAFADIVMTLTVVDLLGINVSLAGVIAFLMLIGYSVDTDILLTTRVIRRDECSINLRVWESFKTGITMTLTAIAAVGVSLIVIYNYSDTLRQIFTILLIGLGFDILNTWVTNASIIKWYAEWKGLHK